MARNYSNVAVSTTLTAGISNSTNTIPVAAVTGYPTAPFTAIIEPGTSAEELINVTAVVGSSFTADRGVDGTPAQTHGLGSAVVHGVSARDFSEPQAHISATTSVHGISNTSNLATKTGTETLTNKTLTSPAINGPTVTGGTLTSSTLVTPTVAAAGWTNATHDHSDAAHGGTLSSGSSAVYLGGVFTSTAQPLSTSTSTNISGLSFTFTAPSSWPSGATKLLLQFSLNFILDSGSGSSVMFRFREGSSTLDPPGEIYFDSGLSGVGTISLNAAISLPSAGSHTYVPQINPFGLAGWQNGYRSFSAQVI